MESVKNARPEEKKRRLTVEITRPVNAVKPSPIAEQIYSFANAHETGDLSITKFPPPARITLEGGELIDARFGLLSGLEAAIALINLSDSPAEFIAGQHGHQRTIELTYIQVLSEAARRQNEKFKGKQTPVSGEVLPKPPFLQVLLGSMVTTYPLRPGISYIGRSAINDIVIADTTVSQLHASLECSPRGVLLRDLQSTNGTFISGEDISEHWLKAEEHVQIGAVECLFFGLPDSSRGVTRGGM